MDVCTLGRFGLIKAYSGAVALLDWLIWATADAAIPTFVLILLQILVHFPWNVDSTDQSNLSR